MTQNLKPYFEKEISCIFSCDDNYAPYLDITIKSLIENSSDNKNYCIYILEENLSDSYIKKLNLLEKENLKIQFVNMKDIFSKYDENIFLTCSYFTKAMYNRCFIPEIFENFEKVLYFDCDVLFLEDVAKLYEINLRNNLVGACKDIVTGIDFKFREYLEENLKLKNPENYFNSGVMIFNIKAMKNNSFTQNFINTLKCFNELICPDQDILNIILENKVLFIDKHWNTPAALNEERKLKFNYGNAKICHFCGEKAWNNPDLHYANYFWKLCKNSSFYEEIIFKAMDYKIQNLNNVHLKYYHPSGLKKIFSIQNTYFNGKKEKFITIFGFTFKK